MGEPAPASPTPAGQHTPQHIFVSLRRTDTSQPWGFRMKGGAQMGMPLFVEQVAPNGRAHKGGMAPGDLIVVICGTNVAKCSHDQAKSEILRAGNELDFTLQRGTPSGRSPLEALHHIQGGGAVRPESPDDQSQVKLSSPYNPNTGGAVRPVDPQPIHGGPQGRVSQTTIQPHIAQEPRSSVVEEHTCSLGGPTYKDVKPKTYQILEQQLGPETNSPTRPGGGPSSIFDRKHQERSSYLNAQGNTIQKAYGEQ